MSRNTASLLAILLFAFALRTHRLLEIPPGLTHDEANQGESAWQIMRGDRPIFFSIGYGREPLFSYLVAGSMSLFGEGLLALRLVNIFSGLLIVAAAWLVACNLFGRNAALLTAALIAISFWPLSVSRQSLRASMLPLFIGGAVYYFWQILDVRDRGKGRHPRLVSTPMLGFGFCVAISLYMYLAARITWLIFPLFLVYAVGPHRHLFRRSWRPTLLGLTMAALIAAPMFIYLRNNPGVLTRLDILDQPAENLRAGNFSPLLANATAALKAIVWPGSGDHFLAYNIPGRPVLNFLSAVCFVFGILNSLWRWRRPEHALLLLWFIIGISPSLVTGPTAGTTRNAAALIPIYLLAANGFITGSRLFMPGLKLAEGAYLVLALPWLVITSWLTVRDYFVSWGESPEVRGAYQHTLVEELSYLDPPLAEERVVISTIYPGPAHDPTIGKLILPNSYQKLSWIDARTALLLPNTETGRATIPSSTPPHPAFLPFLHVRESIALRSDDLDPAFMVYSIKTSSEVGWPQSGMPNFGDAAYMLEARWLAMAYRPGDTAELLTVWKVKDPYLVGPTVPPVGTTDVVLFTHVLNSAGNIIAQQDSLDAPSWDWQKGDIILQVHPIVIPEDVGAGLYQTAVGIYDRLSGKRLPLVVGGSPTGADRAFVAPLQIDAP